MFRITNLFIILALTVFAIGLVGCGDDSTSSELKQGSANDPEYLLVSSQLNAESLQADMIMFGLSFELIDMILDEQSAGKMAAANDSSEFETIYVNSYVYDTTNSWHIFSVSVSGHGDLEEDVDSVFFEGIDSIRFEGTAGPMRYPDSLLTTTVKTRYHFDVEAYGEEGTFDVSTNGSVDFVGEFDGDFVIDGATSDSIAVYGEDDDGSIALESTTNQTFDGLLIDSVVQEDEGCPNSGEVNVINALQLDITATDSTGTDSLSIGGIWTANFVFHSDRSVTIKYNDGTYYWEATEDCSGGDDPTKLSWARAAKALYK